MVQATSPALYRAPAQYIYAFEFPRAIRLAAAPCCVGLLLDVLPVLLDALDRPHGALEPPSNSFLINPLVHPREQGHLLLYGLSAFFPAPPFLRLDPLVAFSVTLRLPAGAFEAAPGNRLEAQVGQIR